MFYYSLQFTDTQYWSFLCVCVCVCVSAFLATIYLSFHSLSVFSFCYTGRLCIFHLLIPLFIYSLSN